MAEIKKVTKLDDKLMEMDIIDPSIEKDYQLVHAMLNRHVRKTGKILTDETFKKGDEALRKWLMLLYKKGATQDKLTSYLRCGLAHLSFDYIESNFSKIDLDDLISRALKSFKQRGFHKTFFKVSSNEMNELASRKKSQRKKAAKKSSQKKVKSKKATKKTAKKVSKKAVKKTAKKSIKKTVKPSTKKASVKKKTATKAATKKKKATKKSTTKKKTNKKPAAKKKSTAKKSTSKKKINKKPAAKKKGSIKRPASKKKMSTKKKGRSKSAKSKTAKKLGKKVNALLSKLKPGK